MRIAILGAGGVGGYFGARLAQAGHDVHFIARGAHLAALRAHGIAVESPLGDFVVDPVHATADPEEIGEVDHVLLAVKTWQLDPALMALKPLIGPATAVVTTQNGVDAPQQVADVVGRSAVLPGAVEVIALVDGPGRIRHLGNGKLTFGEWDNQRSARVDRLAAALTEAGLTAVVAADVWAALWTKFLTLASFGAVGAVTDAPYSVLRSRPGTRQLIEDCMREIQALAAARNVPLADGVIATRMAFLDTMPPTGTTSLQRDILAGRPSELDAWAGAVVRIGRETGTPTPNHSLLYELVNARISGRQPA
jgi:2-dehydropantoate 2-reductase